MEENSIMSSIDNLILELDNKNSKSNSLIKRNYDWYKRASRRNRIWWYIFQLLAFITSVSTSILIAFTKSDFIITNSWKITLT
jgi:uncharacterized membrane protein